MTDSLHAEDEIKPAVPCRVGYILEGLSGWLQAELRAVHDHGLSPLICMLDASFEDKIPSIARAKSVSWPGLIAANLTALMTIGIRKYYATVRTLQPIMGWQFVIRTMFFVHLCRRERIQHLHAHFATSPALVAMTLGELLDIPFSFTIHAYDIFKGDIDTDLLCHKIERAVFVRCISEYNVQTLTQLCPKQSPDKYVVIHCGAELERFPFKPSEETTPFTILSLTNLVEKKGLPFIIEACQILKERGRSFRYILVGNGPERDEIHRMIQERDLHETIEMLPGCTHEEVAGLLHQASVFALPCVVAKDGDRDGIPVVLMEAMSTGLPVVSTTVSGIPELISHRETGMIVPPEDATALADAVEELMDDMSLRHGIGVRGREKVRAAFNMQVIGQELVDIFTKACNAAPQ